MTDFFVWDERLGIQVPQLENDFEDYSPSEQANILLRWEEIRGTIPNRIFELEHIIIHKQEQLDVEDNFIRACELNSEIAELASTINDLHLWFRVDQDMETKVAHH